MVGSHLQTRERAARLVMALTEARYNMVVLFWLVLLVASIGCSALLYWLMRSIIIASLIGALLIVAAFQLVDWLQLGHLDKFWPIAVILTFVISLAVSVVTTVCLNYLLRKKETT